MQTFQEPNNRSIVSVVTSYLEYNRSYDKIEASIIATNKQTLFEND